LVHALSARDERSTSHYDRFKPREEGHGRLVGPSGGLDDAQSTETRA